MTNPRKLTREEELVKERNRQIRDNCLAVIQARRVNDRKLAGLLGCEPFQARQRLSMPEWEYRDGVVIADALGLSLPQALGPDLNPKAIKAIPHKGRYGGTPRTKSSVKDVETALV